jgi:nucleoside-diphosphate-sugar epimerase
MERVGSDVEVVAGDVTEPATLAAAFQGVDTAYYLIHALAASGDFESTELFGARNFAEAAKTAGVKRIIYLGGARRLGESHIGSHAEPSRGRSHLSGVGCTHVGVSSIDHHWARESILRTNPKSGEKASNHDRAEMGSGKGTAHRY